MIKAIKRFVRTKRFELNNTNIVQEFTDRDSEPRPTTPINTSTQDEAISPKRVHRTRRQKVVPRRL